MRPDKMALIGSSSSNSLCDSGQCSGQKHSRTVGLTIFLMCPFALTLNFTCGILACHPTVMNRKTGLHVNHKCAPSGKDLAIFNICFCSMQSCAHLYPTPQAGAHACDSCGDHLIGIRSFAPDFPPCGVNKCLASTLPLLYEQMCHSPCYNTQLLC